MGILWGANIGTIYPFVKVAIRGRTLQQWVERQDRRGPAERRPVRPPGRAAPAGAAVAPAAEVAKRRWAIQRLQSQRQIERAAEARYAWIRPWIVRYVPSDPFLTLTTFIGVLLVLTLAKTLFLMANTMLVSRLSNLGSLGLRRRFFRRSLNMDVATFTNDGTSDLMSRFTHDTEAVTGGLDGCSAAWSASR